MKIQLIRHATAIIFYNNKKLLIDPVLSKKGTIAPIPDVPNMDFNPLVDLPVGTDYLIDCDAVILTHTHKDHFDDEAVKMIPKDKLIFCQPKDRCKIEAFGFRNIRSIYSSIQWEGINLSRTGGRHGHGVTALAMAPVSGYVISSSNEEAIYITGDTVWCSKVSNALNKFKPDIVITYSGSAQFAVGKPITMNSDDLLELSYNSPRAKIIAIHMEAWNHCRLTRKDLKTFIKAKGLEERFLIPDDGQILNF